MLLVVYMIYAPPHPVQCAQNESPFSKFMLKGSMFQELKLCGICGSEVPNNKSGSEVSDIQTVNYAVPDNSNRKL